MSDAPVRIGHSDTPLEGGRCGCCEGVALSTVQSIGNRPNLSAIAYRVGDHPRFKASMLSALASAELGALARLGTRDDEDFTIALIDAWAAVCEVLSFYQERHANEAYLQSARERLSIGEIARLIGYRLQPGSAAEVDLTFLMDDPPGAEPDVADLEIEAGTRVQSQPGPGEQAQLFETLDPLSARVAWNRLRPRQNRPIVPIKGDDGTWLEGQTTGLTPGDAVLIVGSERESVPDSERWDFRRLVKVEPDASLDRTWVEWDRRLGSIDPPGSPAASGHRFFVFRDRGALFGHNAPHPLVLGERTRDQFGYTGTPGSGSSESPSKIAGTDAHSGDWSFTIDSSAKKILLDVVYPRMVEGGWVVLTLPSGLVELYRITDAKDDGVSRYAIGGRATQLTLDTDEGLSHFAADYRRTAVYGGGEEIRLAETPLIGWVGGAEIELDARVEGLAKGRRLILSGPRAQVLVAVASVTLDGTEGTSRPAVRGTRLTLTAPPQPVPGQPRTLLWRLADADGYEATLEAAKNALIPVRAETGAAIAAELAVLERVEDVDPSHSRVRLSDALTHAFDRAALSIHANVARASHGEGATEILGSGNPSRPHQSFALKQNPVTQLVAPTENGVESTLSVRIDGVRWDEAPDLHARDPKARVFATALSDAGETVIRFGDGVSGARPPAGRDNIVADYRKGLGRSGNLRAGQLVLPLDRPLGLREVNNALPASGGADPEAAEDARRNAPVHTLTLGRVVSVTDYRDFALGYPGIGKADARWVWDGETRRVVVTVAGEDGAVIAEDGPTYPALLAAYRELGDPFVPFELISYEPSHFRLGLKVAVDPAFEPPAVLDAVDTALRAAFAFDARDFVEPVALSRVAAVAHEVAGVVAVDVDRLYRDDPPQSAAVAHPLLMARTGRLGPGGTLRPAEVLTLSPDPLAALEVMS